MKKYLLLSILFSVFLCQTAVADFYKWVDEKGETQITDYPPPQNKAAKLIEVQKSESENPVNQENKDDASKTVKKINNFLYTKNDCKDCDKARDFLNSKNAPFIEYNMDNDKNAAIKRKEVDDGVDVPFAIINRNQVHGFSESVYERVLQMEP